MRMRDLKLLILTGSWAALLASGASFIAVSTAYAQNNTPAAIQSTAPAAASDATAPAADTLNQQTQLQSTAAANPANTALPAATGQTANAPQGQPEVALTPAGNGATGGGSALPSLSSILQQTGLGGGSGDQPAAATTTTTTTTTQEVSPNQAVPPGFDLPVDQNLPEAPAQTDEERAAEIRQQAFAGASQGLMPMKTDEIRRILEMYDETQQAVQTPIYPNPKPESTFQTISLDPGQPPVELKTSVGHVTTLSMVDASGQPWPIQDISWAGNFEVLQPESGSNMLRITPMADFAFGNVSMRMIGLNPPVIITLRTDRKAVQVRADVQIPEIGPNGVAPPIQQQVTTVAGDSKLATILEGVPPASANRLKVDGIDGRTTAFDVNGLTYVRTPYTLLSPAWDSSVRSADGTNVYAMKFTPVLLLSDKGKMVRAQLSRMETSDE